MMSDGTEAPLVLGLGGSAGAVEALQHFFDAVPAEPGLAFVVVMHMDPEQESQLAEILESHTTLSVTQVTEPTEIAADHVYVTAPGRTLLVEGTTLVPQELTNPTERQSPIDQFFRSLAGGALHPMAAVLSGAGTDGSVGLRAITEAGGLTGVQDPSEAQHSSMPRSAIETSPVDFVLPVAELARRFSQQEDHVRRLRMPEEPDELDEDETKTLKQIFQLVRSRTGHDFSEYKRSTMLRRIQRQLQVHQKSSLEEYLAFLQEHPSDVKALQKDFLISVTNFFRDPEAFEALREQMLLSLFAGKEPEDQVRVWVVGCATGEEAYSVAILLLEQAAAAEFPIDQIQVFASDIDEEALATARQGRYPDSIAADVPERYLSRFFTRDGATYVVRESVRDRILFTPHSLLKDPPFSKLDLVSCRNLLIYLRRDLQRAVFDLFSYALNDDGYLFLGSSESVDLVEEDFRVIDKQHRLYQRSTDRRPIPELPSMPLTPRMNPVRWDENRTEPAATGATVHRQMLEAYAPPSLVVDEDHNLIHLSSTVGRYLQHPGGPPNTNVLEVVRPELRVRLRSALREALAEDREVRTAPVQVQFDGEEAPVRVVVRPGPDRGEGQDPLALVVFDEPEETPDANGEAAEVPEAVHDSSIEAELQETKKELRATIEEYETSKQEMRAANEELRSMNEEYKSMTEELETSKEELQSVNEELKTVNQELEDKVDELREANNDLRNLLAATEIGTLFLDRDLTIQRFTPRIEELFHVQEADVGRPIGNFTHQLDYDTLVDDAEEVLDTLVPVEREAQSEGDEWFLVRHHPYRTADDQIEGVVVTFVDITRRKEAEQELRSAHEDLAERAEQIESLSEALTSAEERERKRISKILHDDLQQTIFAARMRVNHLEERSEFSEEQAKLATRAIELLDESIETTRSLSSELDPPVGEQSLSDSLEWLAMHMEQSYNLSVEMKARGAAKTADKNLRYLLFRLVRELLFNVVKHADVDEAFLFLVEGEDRLRIVVKDEGDGFDPAEQKTGKGGLGLVSVRERIEMIGGRFEVVTAPGEGTRITIEVPWQREMGNPSSESYEKIR